MQRIDPSAVNLDVAQDPILKVSRRSVVDDVRRQLLALIESGHFRLDERLPSENALARSFNVSRPMIREALVGLQALGLTTSRVGRGTFVVAGQGRAPGMPKRYPSSDLTEARLLVEVPAASFAAVRRSPEHLRRLGELQAALISERDEASRRDIDSQFHLCIAHATDNAVLIRLVADLRAILDEQAVDRTTLPPRLAAEIAEHQAIYEAVACGDAKAAARAMEEHLRLFDQARNNGQD